MPCLKLLILVLLAVAVMVSAISRLILANWLRKRSVAVNSVWIGVPGYLESLYWQQIPDAARSSARRLVDTARLSAICAALLIPGLIFVVVTS